MSAHRPSPVLQVVLGDEQLAELARLVAQEILAASPADAYDQDHPPVGLTARTYLNAARAGRFPSRKVGRKVVASKADVDRWIASRPSAARPKKPPAAANDGSDAEVARLVNLNHSKGR